MRLTCNSKLLIFFFNYKFSSFCLYLLYTGHDAIGWGKHLNVAYRYLIIESEWNHDQDSHTVHHCVTYGSNYSEITFLPFLIGTPWNSLKDPWGSPDHTLKSTGLWDHFKAHCIIPRGNSSARNTNILLAYLKLGTFRHPRNIVLEWSPPAAGQGPELLTRLSNICLWLSIATLLFPGQRVPPPRAFKGVKGGVSQFRGSCLEKKGVSGETKCSLFS